MLRCPGPGSPGGLSRARLGSCRTLSPPRDTRWHCGVLRPRLTRGCGSSWGHGAMVDGSITGGWQGKGQGWQSDQEPRPFGGHGRTQWTNTVQGSGSKLPEGDRQEAGHTPRHSYRLQALSRAPGHTRPHPPSPAMLPARVSFPALGLACSPPPLLRPTLLLTQRGGVPETAESPREPLAHFARPGIMQLKLAQDRQVGDPPAPCPPGPSLAPPHPRSSPPSAPGTSRMTARRLRCSKEEREVP